MLRKVGKLISLLMKIVISQLEMGIEQFEKGEWAIVGKGVRIDLGGIGRPWVVKLEDGKGKKREYFRQKGSLFEPLLIYFFVNGGFLPD